MKVYGDISAGIRETDAISFKLLGLVPVVSGGGAAALVFLLETDVLGPLSIGSLALLGAVSTFAVYRWELRNIQTCNRLWDRAAAIERRLGFGVLAGREEAPRLFGTPIGKGKAANVHASLTA